MKYINNKDNPLVSVCIITYNSSKYILEALDSVYNQTYQNIELVVTDDGSKDNTIDLTKKWLSDRKDRFANVIVLNVENNTGTTSNCNRGLKASNGEYFKYFAGDDVLLPEAIDKYISFVKKNPKAKWVFARAIRYNEIISDQCVMRNAWSSKKLKVIFRSNEIDQFRRLVIQNFLWYPTHFFKKDVLVDLNGFDEEFGIYEDYPTWLRLYRNEEKCYFLDECTLGYRYTNQSVVNNPGFLLNKNIRKLAFVARKKFAFDKVTWVEVTGAYLLYWLDMFFSLPFMNKKTKFKTILRNKISALIQRTCFLLQRLVKVKKCNYA